VTGDVLDREFESRNARRFTRTVHRVNGCSTLRSPAFERLVMAGVVRTTAEIP